MERGVHGQRAPRPPFIREEQWREASHSVAKSARARMIAAQRKMSRRKMGVGDIVRLLLCLEANAAARARRLSTSIARSTLRAVDGNPLLPILR